MSLFGFSARGRGWSESLTDSLLPLSHGKAHTFSLAPTQLSIELPTPPPLPPLPCRRHDNKDEHSSSYKVTTTPITNTINTQHHPSTRSKFTTGTQLQHNQFEGKISPSDIYSTNSNRTALSILHHPSMNSLLRSPDNSPPSNSFHSQGTAIYGFQCQILLLLASIRL